MLWIAPSEKDTDNAALEKRLWDAANQIRANSASDARASEQELRRQFIESRAVDVMVAVGPNLFYTATLPCTLRLVATTAGSQKPRLPRLDAGKCFRQTHSACSKVNSNRRHNVRDECDA